jgi:hypothetical protein
VYICRMAYINCKNDLPKYSHLAEEDSCSVEGKENSMAYMPAFDRRMRIVLTSGSQRLTKKPKTKKSQKNKKKQKKQKAKGLTARVR